MKTHLNHSRHLILILLAAFLLFCIGKASAQVLPEYKAFPSASIGLLVGSQGFGVQGSKNFLGAFDIRAGFSTIPDISIKYNNRQALFNRTSVYAIADWQPQYGNNTWFARKWFVSAGAAEYMDNNVYRQGIGATPNYTVYLAKCRPYIGTGLGNLAISGKLALRLDLGEFLPTAKSVSTYENSTETIINGLSLLPGLNVAATIYFKF